MSFTLPILTPLTDEEAAANGGFNWRAIVTADMLTQATNNTLQTLTLMTLVEGDFVWGVIWRVKNFFKDASDTGFNSTLMSVGDNSAVDTHIDATELNINGTEVRSNASATLIGPYSAADTVSATFNAMAAKALNSLDVGEIHIFIRLIRPTVLVNGLSAMSITTK